MANLKLDLINKITNVKYFDEIEFIQLAQNPTMDYREKLDKMEYLLSNIAINNSKLGLVEQYLPDNPPQQAPVGNKQQSKIHEGQSHGE